MQTLKAVGFLAMGSAMILFRPRLLPQDGRVCPDDFRASCCRASMATALDAAIFLFAADVFLAATSVGSRRHDAGCFPPCCLRGRPSAASLSMPRQPSNESMERTAARRASAFCVGTIRSLRSVRALGGGRSSLYR